MRPTHPSSPADRRHRTLKPHPDRPRRILAALVFASFAALTAVPAHAQWSVGAGLEQFDWREHTEPIEVHESGLRYAAAVGFMLPKDSGVLFGARARGYGGSVDYNGSFQFDQTEPVSGASTYLGAVLGGDVRYRWPIAIDAVAGLEFDLWKRQLSSTQREDYQVLSMRIGAERVARGAHAFGLGVGMRFMLDATETASVEQQNVRYELTLSPGLESNPYVHASYRVLPNATLVARWDVSDMGQSNEVTLVRRGRPRAVVSQPATDVSTLGFGIVYGF